VNKIRIKQAIPTWNKPADDPVKAVLWFMHWLLKVLVHFFWIPMLVMSLFETLLNWNTSGFLSGLVSGMTTLLLGLVIWGLLYAILYMINLVENIVRIMSDVKQFQKRYDYTLGAFRPFIHTDPSNFKSDPKIIESTVIKIEEEL
jgi:ABC-type multidrug transport system fused ATPase/permease subunit